MSLGRFVLLLVAAVFLYPWLWLFVPATWEWFGYIERPPPHVTCQGLRQLRIGMTPSEVERLIGQPYTYGPTGSDRHGRPVNSETHARYDHDTTLTGGWRLSVRYDHERLTSASVSLKTFTQQMGRWYFLRHQVHVIHLQNASTGEHVRDGVEDGESLVYRHLQNRRARICGAAHDRVTDGIPTTADFRSADPEVPGLRIKASQRRAGGGPNTAA